MRLVVSDGTARITLRRGEAFTVAALDKMATDDGWVVETTWGYDDDKPHVMYAHVRPRGAKR